MAMRRPEAIPLEEWRSSYWTVQRMIDGRWAVTGTCELCELKIGVRLKLIRLAASPAVVLWGRTLACPRWGCQGRMHIEGRPPQMSLWLDISRSW